MEKNPDTVEPQYNEVPRDWQNVFVITEIRYIGVLSIYFTITGLKNMILCTGVFVM